MPKTSFFGLLHKKLTPLTPSRKSGHNESWPPKNEKLKQLKTPNQRVTVLSWVINSYIGLFALLPVCFAHCVLI